MFLKTAFPIVAALLQILISCTMAGDGPTAEDMIARLVGGNKRFVAGSSTHPHQTVDYRATLAAGQKPFVAILTCADSRVSPELIFDLGLGDAFVCRVAGNVASTEDTGSLEYAIEHLHVGLIVVLGHEKCGAVKAAVDGVVAPGHIGSLVEKIAPAVEEARQQSGDLLANAVRANVIRVVKLLSVSEPILTEHLHEGTLKIVGARYDIATGIVEFIPVAAEATTLKAAKPVAEVKAPSEPTPTQETAAEAPVPFAKAD